MLGQMHLAVALRVMVVVGVVSLLVGCATMRYGCAPEPSFDIQRDLEQLSQQFEPSTSITEFYASTRACQGVATLSRYPKFF